MIFGNLDDVSTSCHDASKIVTHLSPIIDSIESRLTSPSSVESLKSSFSVGPQFAESEPFRGCLQTGTPAHLRIRPGVSEIENSGPRVYDSAGAAAAVLPSIKTSQPKFKMSLSLKIPPRTSRVNLEKTLRQLGFEVGVEKVLSLFTCSVRLISRF